MIIRFLKNYLLVSIIIICFGKCQPLAQGRQGLNSFVTAQIKKDLYFLASDSLKGRVTPSPELNSAAVYIASKFKSSGLKPVNGVFFQIVKMGYKSLADNNSLTVKSENGEDNYLIKKDFTPFEMTGNKSVTAPVIFAGYGIDAPEYNYNDYANINVKDKIVFVLRHEPGEKDSSSVFGGIEFTKYSGIDVKVKTAIKHGATGIMIAQDPLNHIFLTPTGYPWPSLSKVIPDDILPLSLLEDADRQVPVVQVGESVIGRIFGSTDNLKNIQYKIDKNVRPNSFELKGLTASIKTSLNISETDSKNVVGYIEGSDPELKDQVIIIGAHYDHIGMKKNHKKGEDYIFNGADDNASGTSALMAVASAFGKSGVKPKRSILFIAFCGEEEGLFGSEYYTSHPLFPIGKTVAMLNMDMLGRNNIDSLFVYGSIDNARLTEYIKKADKEINFQLTFKDKIINGDSDHSSFRKCGIASVSFHSGIHADLHSVTDEASKINYEKVKKAAELVYLTAVLLADN